MMRPGLIRELTNIVFWHECFHWLVKHNSTVMAQRSDPQLLEVQKLCRDFSEARFKEADRESESKVTSATERYVSLFLELLQIPIQVHCLLNEFSARVRAFDQIEDERVTQEKNNTRSIKETSTTISSTQRT